MLKGEVVKLHDHNAHKESGRFTKNATISSFKRNSLSSKAINNESFGLHGGTTGTVLISNAATHGPNLKHTQEALPQLIAIDDNDIFEIKNAIKTKTYHPDSEHDNKTRSTSVNKGFNRKNNPADEQHSSKKAKVLLTAKQHFKPHANKENLETINEKHAAPAMVPHSHRTGNLNFNHQARLQPMNNKNLPSINKTQVNSQANDIGIGFGLSNALTITGGEGKESLNGTWNHNNMNFNSSQTNAALNPFNNLLSKTANALGLLGMGSYLSRPVKASIYSGRGTSVDKDKNQEKEKVILSKKPNTTSKVTKVEVKPSFPLNPNSLVKEYAHIEEANAPYRDYMEDFVKVTDVFMGDPTKILFGLYDGHGGGEVAKTVKDKLPELFSKFLSEKYSSIESALISTFKKQDELLKKHEHVGSTANLTYICSENESRVIYSANIGDSRTVLVRKNKAERLSYDHKGTDQNESERVRFSGGIIFAGRVLGQLAITRAFGDYSLKTYGVSVVPFISRTVMEETDTFLVMGSDGLWDVIDDEFVYRLSLGTDNAEEFAKILVQNAMTLGSLDNISCIVVKLN